MFGWVSDWFSSRESHSRNPSIPKTWEAGIIRLRKKIENPSRFMKRVGLEMVAESQKAFRNQCLGDIQWDERYPNQTEPFINYAGALMDLQKGASVKSRRFDRRPALVDTGMLSRSIAVDKQERPNVIKVGTTREGMAVHQWGGETRMRITETMIANLEKILEESKAKARRAYRWKFGQKMIKSSSKSGSGEAIYLTPQAALAEIKAFKKLKRRIQGVQRVYDRELVTEVNRRPFVGITDSLAQKIVRMVKEEFSR